MNIGYDAYRVFYYTAKYRSFTQAAKALGSSQPNVSRMIRNLEQAMDCTLLLRSNRQVTLTAEGQTLYRYVSAAFEQLQAGEQALLGGDSLDGGFLRIAATEVSLRAFLLPILGQFHTRYPGVHIRLFSNFTPGVLAHLEQGLADLAFVTTPVPQSDALQTTPLKAVQEVAVAGSAYAHLCRQALALEQLAEQPLISLAEQSASHAFYLRWFASHGLPFQPDIEAATAEQILPLVQANLGIGFVPEEFLHPGLSVQRISLDVPIPLRQICLTESASHIHSPAARAFRKMCLDAAGEA